MKPVDPRVDKHMPEQLSLPGLDARPAPWPVDLHHLFFAVLPDPAPLCVSSGVHSVCVLNMT